MEPTDYLKLRAYEELFKHAKFDLELQAFVLTEYDVDRCLNRIRAGYDSSRAVPEQAGTP